MQFRTFSMQPDTGIDGPEEFNQFLNNPLFQIVKTQEVYSERLGSWTVCVQYLIKPIQKKAKKDKFSSYDPLVGLSPIECARYDLICKIRTEIREDAGVKAYEVLVNVEAAALAKKGEITTETLESCLVKKDKDERIAKYGAKLIERWNARKEEVQKILNEKSKRSLPEIGNDGQSTFGVVQSQEGEME